MIAVFHISHRKSFVPKALQDSPDNGCVVRFAQTPSGGCNFFAPILQGLEPWISRGIYLEVGDMILP